jgi:hypothetical protein
MLEMTVKMVMMAQTVKMAKKGQKVPMDQMDLMVLPVNQEPMAVQVFNELEMICPVLAFNWYKYRPKNVVPVRKHFYTLV